jgi:hypothetical protein
VGAVLHAENLLTAWLRLRMKGVVGPACSGRSSGQHTQAVHQAPAEVTVTHPNNFSRDLAWGWGVSPWKLSHPLACWGRYFQEHGTVAPLASRYRAVKTSH